MKKILILFILLFFCIIGVLDKGYAAEYYVCNTGSDVSGDGSLKKPWGTINYGTTHLNHNDTLFVRGGIYKGTLRKFPYTDFRVGYNLWKDGTYVYAGRLYVRKGDAVAYRSKQNHSATSETEPGLGSNWQDYWEKLDGEARITLKAYSGERPILDGTYPVLDAADENTGWEKCVSNEPGLTVHGITNVHSNRIYKTKIHESNMPGSLFIGGAYGRICRWPNQEWDWGDQVSSWEFVKEESEGDIDRVTDNTHFDPANPNGFWYVYVKNLDKNNELPTYWNNAIFHIWHRRSSNNNTSFNKIVGYETDGENHALLAENEHRGGLVPGELDKYSIIKHPHVLDSPGEYYFTPEPNDDGYYTYYLWPKDEITLGKSDAEVIAYLNQNAEVESYGSAIYAASKNYVTIDGIEFRKYKGDGIKFNYSSDGVEIKNCIIRNVGGRGIELDQGHSVLIENCVVENAGSFGIRHSGGYKSTIRGCTISGALRTGFSISGGRRITVINNIFHSSVGVHGNATAFYDGVSDLLVAFNTVYSNLAFHAARWIAYGNVSFTDGRPYTPWSYQGGEDNFLVALHNVAFNGSGYHAIPVASETTTGHPTNAYIINNILEYWGRYNGEHIKDQSNNLYIKRIHHTVKVPESCIDASNTPLSEIFTNSTNNDATLAPGSPAINAGKPLSEIMELLNTLGIIELFPDFDFTRDKAGNIWAERPSIGAYEFNPREYIPENDADSLSFSKTWALSCYNNLIKPSLKQAATIRISVKESSDVTVIIYNSSGKEIIRLWDGHKDDGEHDFTWDGSNAAGKLVGSGVYMVHMRAVSYKETKKIVVVR